MLLLLLLLSATKLSILGELKVCVSRSSVKSDSRPIYRSGRRELSCTKLLLREAKLSVLGSWLFED